MDRPRPMAHEMDAAVLRLAGVAGRLDAVLGKAPQVRMATVGLDGEGPIVCGLEVDSVTLAEQARIESVVIVRSLTDGHDIVVGELPGPYPDEDAAVEVLLPGQQYAIETDAKGRRIMYAEQMPEVR